MSRQNGTKEVKERRSTALPKWTIKPESRLLSSTKASASKRTLRPPAPNASVSPANKVQARKTPRATLPPASSHALMLEVEKVGKAVEKLPSNLGPRPHPQQPQDSKAPEKVSAS